MRRCSPTASTDALQTGHDIGGAETLAAYARARRPDVTSRTWSVDLLNRSLVSDLLPVHLARGAGLFALKAIATVAPPRHTRGPRAVVRHAAADAGAGPGRGPFA